MQQGTRTILGPSGPPGIPQAAPGVFIIFVISELLQN